jgi:hypothetical protein
MNRLRSGTFFVLSAMLSSIICPVMAADVVSSQSSMTEKTTESGDPTVIQHIDSKMEPIAVQSSTKTDPATGEKSTVVQPIIMERHEKVLDTTIIQPEVTETKTRTENVVQTKQAPAVTHKTAVKSRAIVHKPHKHYIVTKHAAAAHSYKPKESSQVQVVETVTHQAALKETTIKAPPSDNPPPAPQIIQKPE